MDDESFGDEKTVDRPPVRPAGAPRMDMFDILKTLPLKTPQEARHLIVILLDIIEEVSPLPAAHRKNIRYDVLDLWRELTSERSTRQADYIGEPAKFAAYLRYFLPWNVVRLIPILAQIDIKLDSDSAVLDIGSGPLTLPIALWIARPELRSLPLKFTCVDRVKRVLDAGISILEGLCMRANLPPVWKIEARKGAFPQALAQTDGGRYQLVTAANVFNESFWKDKRHLDERSQDLVRSLSSPLAPGGKLFLLEPGDPRSGAMLSALRESIIRSDGTILGPCTHQNACPMPGVFLSSAFREANAQAAGSPDAAITPVISARGRSKMAWCHFVLDRGAAPEKLCAFSEATGLPKDRLVASWLYAAPNSSPDYDTAPAADTASSLRIVSDSFRLADGGHARYACGAPGYILARGDLSRLESGTLVRLNLPLPTFSACIRDEKSGAIVVSARADASLPLPPLEPSSRDKGKRKAPGQDSKRGEFQNRKPDPTPRAPRTYRGGNKKSPKPPKSS